MNANSTISDSFGEIYEWIDNIDFSRPKRNIARDFSDAVLMAELLKLYYPKLVDVHNYVAGHSNAKKLENWNMLNRKVLCKIDLKLSKDLISQLATSQSGAIEKVLIKLRPKILKDCKTDRESLYSGYEDGKSEEVKSVLDPDEVANKSVPRHIFERLKQELQEKNEKISILQRKVMQLDSILKMKDRRIDDLTTQITKPLER